VEVTDTIQPLKLTNLRVSMPIVNSTDGTALPYFSQTINNAWSNIIVAFNALASNEGDLAALVAQIQDILNQIVAINGLIVDVNGKLTNASITNSYTDPTNVLSASVSGTTATITIANHNRLYTDGTSVAVTGGTITGLAINTTYYVYYSDPTRAGGTVTYQYSTDQTAAAQVGGVHSVGSIYTDSTATGPISGGGTVPPGTGGGGGDHPRVVSE
jgi:hypothetical protein